MTIESAASRPGHAPTATKLSSKEVLAAMERSITDSSEPESEILYPTAPQSVSWPRVFPQL